MFCLGVSKDVLSRLDFWEGILPPPLHTNFELLEFRTNGDMNWFFHCKIQNKSHMALADSQNLN